MKKSLILLIGLLLNIQALSHSGNAYLERFTAYTTFSQNLPTTATPDFINFISEDKPLSNKLRTLWLYELGKTQNWALFSQYYQPSPNVILICYKELARYHLGQEAEALQAANTLWLTGDTQPGACTLLFQLLLKSPGFRENRIHQRIALALEKRNLSLALYLLKLYKEPRTLTAQRLQTIHNNPNTISYLEKSELSSTFYLYGLKKLVATNINKAIELFQTNKTQQMLNEGQQQSFLAHLALYKALRNQEDASFWFGKIKKAYYTDTLLEWQIRYALKRQDWKSVKQYIEYYQDKENPCWQYWLARATAQLGDSAKAQAMYETLANTRNYYGFLASLQLKKSPTFHDEKTTTHFRSLTPYKPVLDNIQSLYTQNNTLEASRVLNDFISELPKDEASALLYWVDTHLGWHGKSVNLSNNETFNNQLTLRFPLAHQNAVLTHTKQYALPEALVYAIIRQESAFKEDVVSSAGAKGLMQLMPATAFMVAKQEKIPYAHEKQLFMSQKNINLGVAYLSQLAKRFDKHPVFMAAAYNAGPKQVKQWIQNHPPKQMDIWIETLPWQETRNYIKNIVAFYAVYQYRMQLKPNLKPLMKAFKS